MAGVFGKTLNVLVDGRRGVLIPRELSFSSMLELTRSSTSTMKSSNLLLMIALMSVGVIEV